MLRTVLCVVPSGAVSSLLWAEDTRLLLMQNQRESPSLHTQAGRLAPPREVGADVWCLLPGKAIDSVWITQLVGNENATMGKGPLFVSWRQRSCWPVLSPGVVCSGQAAGFWMGHWKMCFYT